MIENQLLRVAGIVACVFILLTSAFCALADETQDSAPHSKEIKALMVERRAVLQEAVRASERAYHAGQAQLASVIESRRELCRADLELATTQHERLAVYKRLVEEATALEKATKTRYESGEATQIDLLKSTAARLEAQIELARAEIQLTDTSKK